jgi:hypothetical protein
VNLKDRTHAEIRPLGAPPNRKPIPTEKVHQHCLGKFERIGRRSGAWCTKAELSGR